jgi:hypothetical protein
VTLGCSIACNSSPALTGGDFAGTSPPLADAAPTDAGSTEAGDASDARPPGTGGSLCDPSHAWAPFPSPAIASGVVRFGGISRDESSVAWTADDGDGGLAIQVASWVPATDASPGAFGTPAPVPAAPSDLAVDRVALASSGSVLFAVTAARDSFLAFAQSGSTWAADSVAQFANLKNMSTDAQGAFYEPVLGADGAFYYLFVPDGGVPALYESTWGSQERTWSTGVALTAGDLASTDATHRRRPTGASSDGLTLFFYDEVASPPHERAAWRSSPTSPFTEFEDVSALAEAAPDRTCDRLYFQQPEASPAGILIAH